MKRVRVELLEEQVKFILDLIEKNEPDEERDVNMHTNWWHSKRHFSKALSRFEKVQAESSKVTNFTKGDFIEIVNVEKIENGDCLWQNHDVVQIKEVDEYDARLHVWNADKSLSEFIYEKELSGIKKASKDIKSTKE